MKSSFKGQIGTGSHAPLVRQQASNTLSFLIVQEFHGTQAEARVALLSKIVLPLFDCVCFCVFTARVARAASLLGY